MKNYKTFLDIVFGFLLGMLFSDSKYNLHNSYFRVANMMVCGLIIIDGLDTYFFIDTFIIFILFYALFEIVFLEEFDNLVL